MASALSLLLIGVAEAKTPSVNGKLKDECAYLKNAIEVTISEIASQNVGAATGKVMSAYGLNTLINAYKQLCD